MSITELSLPDIGDFTDVEVIEVLVQEGDTIEPEQSLITVESDKASMEIPAEQGGLVKAVLAKVGDKLNKGSPIVQIEAAAGDKQAAAPQAAAAGGASTAGASTGDSRPMQAESDASAPSPAPVSA